MVGYVNERVNDIVGKKEITELSYYNSMGECNTILSAYTKYRHLG